MKVTIENLKEVSDELNNTTNHFKPILQELNAILRQNGEILQRLPTAQSGDNKTISEFATRLANIEAKVAKLYSILIDYTPNQKEKPSSYTKSNYTNILEAIRK